MDVKERLIHMIQSADGLTRDSDTPLSRHELIEAFDKSRRAKAAQELSNLIGAGYVNVLGTGRRGSPIRILRNKAWPFDKCPLCGHVNQDFPDVVANQSTIDSPTKA
jgi:hypothetical protein